MAERCDGGSAGSLSELVIMTRTVNYEIIVNGYFRRRRKSSFKESYKAGRS